MKQIVLMYHDVYVNSKSESGFQNTTALQYKISKDDFENHVKAISELKRNDIIFSFDDGGISFYTIIAPILEKYNMRGIFFISTKYIGTSGFLNEAHIKDLIKRNHIIGSHSHTHRELNTLTKEDVSEEWKQSVDILNEIIKPSRIDCASIPNGASNKNVIIEANKCGIKNLYTSEPTTKDKNSGEIKQIGRYVVYDGMTTRDVINIVNSNKKRTLIYSKRLLINFVKLLLGKSYNNIKRIVFYRK